MWGAIVMHGALMLTLGPLGLGHEWGVFLWNVYFGIQAWLLFRGTPADSSLDHSTLKTSGLTCARTWFVRTSACFICLLPALSLAGYWDWWPSWAVYSSRPAMVRVHVGAPFSPNLPPWAQSFGVERPPATRWTVEIDEWSYETCWCPMYPQERYRLAVAASYVERAWGGAPHHRPVDSESVDWRTVDNRVVSGGARRPA